MAVIKPFQCIRPNREIAGRVAALPYDVYNRKEAKEEVEREPYSFLKIDRAETQFEDAIDQYDPCVYKKAGELLQGMIQDGIYEEDKESCYYIYELICCGRSQTGIVACVSIDGYIHNVVKKHENTRADKELDRIFHVDACNAQTGPIFLTYRSKDKINEIVNQVKQESCLYQFTTEDGITHNIWKISNPDKINGIQTVFKGMDSLYIADGHHRAASAVRVGLNRREENPEYTGKEEFNYFLSALFPHDQLMIMDYNRVVADLNGYSKEDFLKKIKENFYLEERGKELCHPDKKASFGMYLENEWYYLAASEKLLDKKDSVKSLDVSILQDYILGPLLGIWDPCTDKRIDFIGGIRGLGELESRVHTDMAVAFSMYPTKITELFAIADDGKLMPPKSTWFEPKLRSGLFIHKL